MSTLAETIHDAMMRLGPATQDRMRDILVELGGLVLGEEDRLAVLATALATMAATHHARHQSVYLEAVRTWSLEISVGLSPPPARRTFHAPEGAVEEGAEILVAGLEALLDGLAQSATKLQDRLVLELSLFAQLLGRHDVNAVHLTLRAVAEALGGADYTPGRAVRVPLAQMTVPLTRDACLATVAPRGAA
jgi:hypothetical protein